MRRSAVLAAVAAVLALFPAGASAFGVTVGAAAPADTAAGANSDFSLAVAFSDGTPKDLAIELPPGLLGDPNASQKCPVATFTSGGCPDAAAVGSASADVVAGGFLPLTATGRVFNLEPEGNEPARLGIALQPPVGGTLYSQSAISVRPDGGLTSTVTGLPNSQSGLPIEIRSLGLTLSGRTAGGTFMRNPTSCGPATTTVRATPYSGEPASGAAAFTPTGCEALPFDPKIAATIGGAGQTGEAGKPALRTVVTQAPGEAGARSIAVTLPQGVATQLTALARACTPEQLAADACPPASQVGTASATVPVLSRPLAGTVRLVRGDGPLPNLEVTLTGQITQRLRGVVTADANGLTTTFDGIPDVPISNFTLAFAAGEAGLLQNGRDLCTTSAPLTGAAVSQGGATRALSVVPEVTGCPKAAGPKARPKRTRASVRLSRVGGERGAAVKLRLRARGVNAKLRRVTLTLPRALRVSPDAARLRTPKGAKARVRSSRTVRVTLPRRGARSVAITLRRGLAASPGLRAATTRRTLRFRVATTYVGGGSRKVTTKVRTRP